VPFGFFFFSFDLGYLGSCLDEYMICMLAGELLTTLEMLLCGR
jgi:hypothetical protein